MTLMTLFLAWCGLQFQSVCIGKGGSGEVLDPLCALSADINGTNFCYWLLPTIHNATSSEANCNADNGTLAYIPNEDVLSRTTTFVKEQLRTESYTYVGYTQTVEGGITIQGTEQTWAPWDTAIGEPDNHEECVTIYTSTGKFHDTNCLEEHYALCSTRYNSNPEITTTDVYDVTTDVTTDVTIDDVTDTNTATCRVNCHCNASSGIIIYVHPVNITEELQAKLDTLKKETEVNEETLSSTIRARTSASDSRSSSAYVGYLGIALLTVVFGGILLVDLSRLASVLKT